MDHGCEIVSFVEVVKHDFEREVVVFSEGELWCAWGLTFGLGFVVVVSGLGGGRLGDVGVASGEDTSIASVLLFVFRGRVHHVGSGLARYIGVGGKIATEGPRGRGGGYRNDVDETLEFLGDVNILVP